MVDTAKAPVAVVTGASMGLGLALAVALARRGVTVAGIARNAETLRAAVSDHPVHAFAADVGDPGAVAATFRDIRDRLGDPAILINNAAVYPHRDILDETPESFMATVGINLGGAFNCCHAVLPAMVERGAGRIINVATFADLRPAPLAAAYSVSKGATRILTRALIADLGDRFPGIVINDWIPGALNTRMGLADGTEPAVAAEWGATLAMMDARSLNGVLFERNCEHIAPKSLKRRLKERLLGRARPPVRLD